MKKASRNKSQEARILQQDKGTQKKRYKKPDSIKELEVLALEKKRERYPNNPYPAPKKYSDKTSNELTKAIIAYIDLNGGQAERISSMGRKIKKRGKDIWIPGTSRNGTADISATINGRSVKIEVKNRRTKDRMSKTQESYRAEVEKAGGIYLIARDFDQIKGEIDKQLGGFNG